MIIAVLFWYGYVVISGVSGNLVLTPGPTATVTENDPLTLTCVYTANSAKSFRWRKDDRPFLAAWYNGCTRANPPPSGYTNTCVKSPDKYTFTLTTPAVTRADHGQTWLCGVKDGVSSEYKQSGVTTVSVPVPISTVVLSPSGSTVAVIAGTVKEFVCETDAGRPQASIRWYSNTGTSSNDVEITGGTSTTHPGGDSLTITRGTLQYTPTRAMAGWRIFCTASNTGATVTSQTATLDVQYPPEVNQIPDQAIEENKQLSITCDTITPGDPAATFKWTRDKDSWSRTGQTLTFTPSRDDADRYTCTASNVMQPSQGGSVPGTDSKSFNVEVYFKSSITTFVIKDHPETTINEKENRTFECSATSNPASTITVMKDTNVVAQSDNTQKVEYPIDNAKCEDSGTYTCTAYNQYNRGVHATTRAIQLIVRCTPRSKYSTNTNIKVNKMFHNLFTLNLTIVAYPRPTSYTWYKLSGSQWVPLSAQGSLQISNQAADASSSNTFVSTLSKSSAEQDDFGQYKLEVQNGIGFGLVQYFTLIPQEITYVEPVSALPVGGIVGGAVAAVVVILVLVGIFVTRRTYEISCIKRTDTTMPPRIVEPPDNTTYDSLTSDRQTGTATYEMIQSPQEGAVANPVYINLVP